MAEEEREQTRKGKVLELLDKKYTRSQLINDFGLAARTVDDAISEYKKNHDGKLPSDHPVAGDEGVRVNNQERFMPVTVKGTEAVTPEFIMQQLADGNNDWQLRLEGMMLLRAAQKMVREDVEIMKAQAEADAKLIEPVLKVMQEARAEQDAAAQRAKESNEEIAVQAAASVGMKIAPKLEQLASQISSQAVAGSPNPMQGLMVSMMSPAFQKAGEQVARLFGGTQPGQAQPEQAQPGSQPQPGGQQENVQQPPQQGWSPPNIEYHSREELED